MSRRGRLVEARGDATIACMSRNIFNQDLEALSRFGFWPLQRISRRQQRWVVEHVRPGLRKQGEYLLESRDRISDFAEARRRANALLDVRSARAILTANFSYYQDEPFRQWANDHDVPFVVLAKEHSLLKSRKEMAAGETALHPRAERLATAAFVAGTDSLAYADAGLVPHQHVHVTGFPRFDLYRFGGEWADAGARRNHLLVLDSGSDYCRPDWNIQGLRRSAAEAAWSFALRPRPAPSLGRRERLPAFAPRWTSRLGATPLDRSKSFSSGLHRAGAVLGPTSIALYETLLTNRAILVWADDRDNPLLRHAGDRAGIFALASFKDLTGVLGFLAGTRFSLRFDTELRQEIFREKFYLDAEPSSRIISRVLADYTGG